LSRSRDDGSEGGLLVGFARALHREMPGLAAFIGVVIGARPVRRGGVNQPSGFVTVDVKLVAPRGS
jgi:hypothetical protein